MSKNKEEGKREFTNERERADYTYFPDTSYKLETYSQIFFSWF